MHKFFTFLQLPVQRKALLLQVVVLLPLCQISVHCLSFNRIVKLFRLTSCQLSTQGARTCSHDKCSATAWAIDTVVTYLNFMKTRCLGQALAGHLILARQGVTTTLFLGVKKNQINSYIAHAWLCCGDYVITGEVEKTQFSIVAAFS